MSEQPQRKVTRFVLMQNLDHPLFQIPSQNKRRIWTIAIRLVDRTFCVYGALGQGPLPQPHSYLLRANLICGNRKHSGVSDCSGEKQLPTLHLDHTILSHTSRNSFDHDDKQYAFLYTVPSEEIARGLKDLWVTHKVKD